MRRQLGRMFLVLVATQVACAQAATVTFPVWQDVSIGTNHSTEGGDVSNYSVRDELLAGDINPGNVVPPPGARNGSRFNLFRFDVNSLPAGATITAAKLTLHLREARLPAFPAINQEWDLFRVREGHGDWQEMAGANGENAAASFTNRRNAVVDPFQAPRPWTGLGASDTTEDIYPGSIGYAATTAGQTGFVDFVFDVNAPDFQGMFEEWRNSLVPNAGVLLKHRVDTGNQMMFDSKEGAALRPNTEFAAVLTVEYIPEPSSTVLAAIALTAGLCLRRRTCR